MTRSSSTGSSSPGVTRSRGPTSTPASASSSPTFAAGARCTICLPSTAMVARTPARSASAWTTSACSAASSSSIIPGRTHLGDCRTRKATIASTTTARTRSSPSSLIVALPEKAAQLGANFVHRQLVELVHHVDVLRQLVFGDDALAVQALEGGQKLQLHALHLFKHGSQLHLVDEPGVLFVKLQLHGARRTSALLGENDFHDALGPVLFGALRVVVVLAVQEDDDVGELLDVAAVPQVRHDRTLVVAVFHRAVQLRQENNRHFQRSEERRVGKEAR